MIGKHLRHARRALSLAALGLLASGTAAAAPTATDDGRWHFNLTVYGWFPALYSSLDTVVTGLPGPNGGTARPVNVSSTIRPSNYLSNLQMAFMMMGEARKDRWLVFGDIVYTSMSSQSTKVRRITGPLGNLSAQIAGTASTDLSSTILTFGGGYALVKNSRWNMDLLAGARYMDLTTNLTLTLVDARGRYLGGHKSSMDKGVWDGIVGAHGEVRLGDSRWFVPYYADIGAGNSNWTWQGLLGLGYRYDWGAVTLAWRALGYQFNQNSANLTMSGPALGVSFRW
ncbi:hypothetical protein [uncultured Thiodictyon sp.]|uniref:hypothetical protein n=1 Tax=uncultured Thiodictyon sp. TaxID=1846217 RepID=UPI0025EBC81C|nr:hypothetical protein [uncultured Thiodictyon sp.]